MAAVEDLGRGILPSGAPVAPSGQQQAVDEATGSHFRVAVALLEPEDDFAEPEPTTGTHFRIDLTEASPVEAVVPVVTPAAPPVVSARTSAAVTTVTPSAVPKGARTPTAGAADGSQPMPAKTGLAAVIEPQERSSRSTEASAGSTSGTVRRLPKATIGAPSLLSTSLAAPSLLRPAIVEPVEDATPAVVIPAEVDVNVDNKVVVDKPIDVQELDDVEVKPNREQRRRAAQSGRKGRFSGVGAKVKSKRRPASTPISTVVAVDADQPEWALDDAFGYAPRQPTRKAIPATAVITSVIAAVGLVQFAGYHEAKFESGPQLAAVTGLSGLSVARDSVGTPVVTTTAAPAAPAATTPPPAPAPAPTPSPEYEPISPNGHHELMNPVPGAARTSPFGNRLDPVTHVYQLHAGIDFGVKTGTQIHAAADGVVVQAGWSGGYGNYTCIDHGNGVKTCYGHQSKISVKVGQHVSRGDIIGLSGSTGESTGPHLHFEVRINGTPVDPTRFL